MRYRNPPKLKRLDFSDFHPLDHRIGDKRCRSLPKARYRHQVTYHLALLWAFKWDVPSKLRAWTRCRIGLHKAAQMWSGRDPETGAMTMTATSCRWCHKQMSDWQPI